MKTISKKEYFTLVGLKAVAEDYFQNIERIKKLANEITGENEGSVGNHTYDFVDGVRNLDELLRLLNITVVEDSVPVVAPELRLRPMNLFEKNLHISKEDFLESVKDGMFTDSDGHAYYANGNYITDIRVDVGNLYYNMSHGRDSFPKDFDGVVWFNK